MSIRKSATYLLGIFSVLIFSLSSCVKDGFDAPSGDGEDPTITVTTTIAELKQLYATAGKAVQITDDLVINGIVISDDREGNFYKSLVIQDASAGILIRIDQTNIYTEFPVGRRVFVKCKNLWVGDFEGLIQMGAFLDSISDPQRPSIESIPTAVVNKYILKGKYNVPIQPVVVTMNQLDFTTYQNMLIQLRDVEFDAEAINTTYADAENKFSQNKKLVDCSNNEILVRTSGYAKFADAIVPSYQGTLNAVYSVFRTDRQLYMNTSADFQANGNNRCTGPGSVNISTIASIRSLFTGATTTLGSSKAIKGIVISDRAAANIDGRNLVIQDSTAGIVIRFSSTHSYSLGDEIEINISGQKLSEFNGLLQAEVLNANAAKTGTGTIAARTLTVAQAVSGLETYESQLVRIQNATLSGGGGKYSGNVSMNDGTGTMNMFTRNAANFASNNYPSGVLSVTGILSQFNSVQLNIRNTNDLQQ